MTKNFFEKILTYLDKSKNWKKVADNHYKYIKDIENGLIPFDKAAFSKKSLKFNEDNTIIYMNSNMNNFIVINIKEDLSNIENIPELDFLKKLKEEI